MKQIKRKAYKNLLAEIQEEYILKQGFANPLKSCKSFDMEFIKNYHCIETDTNIHGISYATITVMHESQIIGGYQITLYSHAGDYYMNFEATDYPNKTVLKKTKIKYTFNILSELMQEAIPGMKEYFSIADVEKVSFR